MSRRQWTELMSGYERFARMDYHEIRLIEALRASRMLNHAAWITERWADPAFPRAFPWFGRRVTGSSMSMILRSRALLSRIRRSGACEGCGLAHRADILRPLHPWYCAPIGFGLNGMSLEKHAAR